MAVPDELELPPPSVSSTTRKRRLSPVFVALVVLLLVGLALVALQSTDNEQPESLLEHRAKVRREYAQRMNEVPFIKTSKLMLPTYLDWWMKSSHPVDLSQKEELEQRLSRSQPLVANAQHAQTAKLATTITDEFNAEGKKVSTGSDAGFTSALLQPGDTNQVGDPLSTSTSNIQSINRQSTSPGDTNQVGDPLSTSTSNIQSINRQSTGQIGSTASNTASIQNALLKYSNTVKFSNTAAAPQSPPSPASTPASPASTPAPSPASTPAPSPANTPAPSPASTPASTTSTPPSTTSTPPSTTSTPPSTTSTPPSTTSTPTINNQGGQAATPAVVPTSNPPAYPSFRTEAITMSQGSGPVSESALPPMPTPVKAQFAQGPDMTKADNSVQSEDVANNFVAQFPEPVWGANCSAATNIVIVPGSEFLGFGWNGKDPCYFETCATRQIMRYTYCDKKTVDLPSGRYMVPDQIVLFPEFDTSATTKVYSSFEQMESATAVDVGLAGAFGAFAGALSFSYSEASTSVSNKYFAQRSINILLYRLYLDVSTYDSDFGPEFQSEVNKLPDRYLDDPAKYVEFLKRWGLFVVSRVSMGGVLDFDLTMEKTGNVSTSAMGAAVEAKYSQDMEGTPAPVCDECTANGGGGPAKSPGSGKEAQGKVSAETKSAEENIESNAMVSIHTNGGEPKIASLISDLGGKGQSFKVAFVNWIESVPRFPASLDPVPKLKSLIDIAPRAKQQAMRMAQDSYLNNPTESMNSLSCQGGTMRSAKSLPRMSWSNYFRFKPNSCVQFAGRSAGPMYVVLGNSPRNRKTWYEVAISSEQVSIKARGLTTNVAETDADSAVAVGVEYMNEDFQVCLINNTLTYGKGDTTYISWKDPSASPLVPTLFGFGCRNDSAYFNDVTVKPADCSKLHSANFNIDKVKPEIVSDAYSSVTFTITGGPFIRLPCAKDFVCTFGGDRVNATLLNRKTLLCTFQKPETWDQTLAPTASPTKAPTKAPTRSPTKAPVKQNSTSPYVFVVSKKADDAAAKTELFTWTAPNQMPYPPVVSTATVDPSPANPPPANPPPANPPAPATSPPEPPATQGAGVLVTPAPPIRAPNSPVGKHIGCFADREGEPDLPFKTDLAAVSPHNCCAKCGYLGYKFAGLQGGNTCFCGNSYGNYGPASDCNAGCTGNEASSETCGGTSKNDVYNVKTNVKTRTLQVFDASKPSVQQLVSVRVCPKADCDVLCHWNLAEDTHWMLAAGGQFGVCPKCRNGWSGTSCGINIGTCEAHGSWSDGVCTCNTGWLGKSCSIKELNCDPGCQNGGTCNKLKGKCVCPEGFSGEFCEIGCPASKTNNKVCGGTQFGTCHGGECQCHKPALQGNACDTLCPGANDDFSKACNGHGVCSMTSGSPMCICAVNSVSGKTIYTGADCKVPCFTGTEPANGQPCSGHGTCSGEAGKPCKCDAGYLGAYCQAKCPGPDGVPCNNRGSCLLVGNTTQCQCNNNYSPSSACLSLGVSRKSTSWRQMVGNLDGERCANWGSNDQWFGGFTPVINTNEAWNGEWALNVGFKLTANGVSNPDDSAYKYSGDIKAPIRLQYLWTTNNDLAEFQYISVYKVVCPKNYQNPFTVAMAAIMAGRKDITGNDLQGMVGNPLTHVFATKIGCFPDRCFTQTSSPISKQTHWLDNKCGGNIYFGIWFASTGDVSSATVWNQSHNAPAGNVVKFSLAACNS